MSTTNTPSGHDVRQSADAYGAPTTPGPLSASPSTITPALLTDREGAVLLNVGLRTFLGLQNEPWFPPPVMLSKRGKRHVAVELLAAVVNRPRPKRAAEPAQLAAGKATRWRCEDIQKLISGGAA